MKILEFAIDESQSNDYKDIVLKEIKESKSFVCVTFDKDRNLHYFPYNVRSDQAVFAFEYAKQIVWDNIFGDDDENA